MPTTITSSGITFNDATSQTTSALAAGAIGTTQLANNAVTSAKLGATENLRLARAWVNFDGTNISGPNNAASGWTVNTTSGSNIGTFVAAPWTSQYVGQTYFINSIGGVAGQTLGGLNVTLGFTITSISGSTATVRFLAGSATSTATATGNGTSSGFTYTASGIRSSLNISSITKNGTGDYTVNYSTAMSDANYSVAIAGGNSTNSGSSSNTNASVLAYTTSSVRVFLRVWDTTFGNVDAAFANIIVFGN